MIFAQDLKGFKAAAVGKVEIQQDNVNIGMVKTAERLGDPFADTMKYLMGSYAHVKTLYSMDKTARWDATNRSPQSKQFVASRLAAGSQMLANL